jgi:hypothetical protein
MRQCFRPGTDMGWASFGATVGSRLDGIRQPAIRREIRAADNDIAATGTQSLGL